MATRLLLCLALSAPLLLTACSPGGDGTPPPATAATAPTSAALPAQVERIERIGRAKPAPFEKELRSYGDTVPAGSVAQLDTLAVRGLLASMARDRALSDQLAQALREWPAGELHASAVIASADISAEYLRQHGDLREARKLLMAVDPALLNSAGIVYRWRYYRQLCSISGDAGELDASLNAGHAALRLAEQMGQPWRVALTLVELAFTTYRADTPARARQIAGQAVGEALKDPDPMTLNSVYTMRGIVHADDSDSSITLQANSDALEQAAKAGADSVRALGLANFH